MRRIAPKDAIKKPEAHRRKEPDRKAPTLDDAVRAAVLHTIWLLAEKPPEWRKDAPDTRVWAADVFTELLKRRGPRRSEFSRPAITRALNQLAASRRIALIAAGVEIHVWLMGNQADSRDAGPPGRYAD